MHSLKTRLFVATVGSTSLVFLAAGVVLYLLIRAFLISDFDASLHVQAKALASLAEQQAERIEIEMHPGQMPEFERPRRPEYFQVWSEDGTTIAKSSSLGEKSLDNTRFTGDATCRAVVLPDGCSGRQLLMTTTILREEDAEHNDPRQGEMPSGAERGESAYITLCVARDTVALETSLAYVAWLLLVVSVLASLLSAIMLLAIVNYGLKPVKVLATRISEIDDVNLANRTTLPSSVDELQPVIDRLNELLERFGRAMEREKSFTADVAHELRTPIAGLITALDVCGSRPRDEAAYRAVITKCLGTVHTMREMVNNLLMLARADAGQLTVDAGRIPIEDFVVECWHPFEVRTVQRGLEVAWHAGESRHDMVTDREKLRLVLQNLFDNAVRHADEGGSISVTIQFDNNQLELCLSNSGCTIPPGDIKSVFDRFWKHDNARQDGADHCGLGIPLCSRIVDVLGGAMAATVDACGVFTVRLTIPGR